MRLTADGLPSRAQSLNYQNTFLQSFSFPEHGIMSTENLVTAECVGVELNEIFQQLKREVQQKGNIHAPETVRNKLCDTQLVRRVFLLTVNKQQSEKCFAQRQLISTKLC